MMKIFVFLLFCFFIVSISCNTNSVPSTAAIGIIKGNVRTTDFTVGKMDNPTEFCDSNAKGSIFANGYNKPAFCDGTKYSVISYGDSSAENGGTGISDDSKQSCCPTRGTQFNFEQSYDAWRTNLKCGSKIDSLSNIAVSKSNFEDAGVIFDSPCKDFQYLWKFAVDAPVELLNYQNPITRVFALPKGYISIWQNVRPSDDRNDWNSGSGGWINMICTKPDCSEALKAADSSKNLNTVEAVGTYTNFISNDHLNYASPLVGTLVQSNVAGDRGLLVMTFEDEELYADDSKKRTLDPNNTCKRGLDPRCVDTNQDSNTTNPESRKLCAYLQTIKNDGTLSIDENSCIDVEKKRDLMERDSDEDETLYERSRWPSLITDSASRYGLYVVRDLKEDCEGFGKCAESFFIRSCDDRTCSSFTETTLEIENVYQVISYKLVEIPVVNDKESGPILSSRGRITSYLIINAFVQSDMSAWPKPKVLIYSINAEANREPTILSYISTSDIAFPRDYEGWDWMPKLDISLPQNLDQYTINKCLESPQSCPVHPSGMSWDSSVIHGFINGNDRGLTIVGLTTSTFFDGYVLIQENIDISNSVEGFISPQSKTLGGDNEEVVVCHFPKGIPVNPECVTLLSTRDMNSNIPESTLYSGSNSNLGDHRDLWQEVRNSHALGNTYLFISKVEVKYSEQTLNGIIAITASTVYGDLPTIYFHCLNDACSQFNLVADLPKIVTSSRIQPWSYDFAPTIESSEFDASLFILHPSSSDSHKDIQLEYHHYPYSSKSSDAGICSAGNVGTILNVDGAIYICSWVPSSHTYDQPLSASGITARSAKIFAYTPLYKDYKTAANWRPEFKWNTFASILLDKIFNPIKTQIVTIHIDLENNGNEKKENVEKGVYGCDSQGRYESTPEQNLNNWYEQDGVSYRFDTESSPRREQTSTCSGWTSQTLTQWEVNNDGSFAFTYPNCMCDQQFLYEGTYQIFDGSNNFAIGTIHFIITPKSPNV